MKEETTKDIRADKVTKYLVIFSDTNLSFEVECTSWKSFIRQVAEYEGVKDEWLSDILDSNAFNNDPDKLLRFYIDHYNSYIETVYQIVNVVYTTKD